MQLEKYSANRDENVYSSHEEAARLNQTHESYMRFAAGYAECAMEVSKFVAVNGVYVRVLDDICTSNVTNISRNYSDLKQQANVGCVDVCPKDSKYETVMTKRDIMDRIRRKIFERKSRKIEQTKSDKSVKVWRPWVKR